MIIIICRWCWCRCRCCCGWQTHVDSDVCLTEMWPWCRLTWFVSECPPPLHGQMERRPILFHSVSNHSVAMETVDPLLMMRFRCDTDWLLSPLVSA